jgi:Fic family protein
MMSLNIERLLQSLTDKTARLAALRPLREASIRSLMAALDVELVYSSNAIEGNALTLAETTAVLDHGVTIAGKPLKDHLEAVHLAAAWARVKELACGAQPLTEAELLELHALVLGRDDADAGRYRSVPVFIRGARHVPPNAAKVPEEMAAVFALDRSGEHPVAAAAQVHFQIVTVHPFVDGNGRTARLAMNLLLLRAGFPPLCIQPEERAAYFAALDAARFEHPEAFVLWIAERAEAELDFWLRHLEGAT